MRIDSSTIGMESARKYRASGTAVRHELIMDYQQFAQQQNGQNLESEEGQEKGKGMIRGEVPLSGISTLRGIRSGMKVRNDVNGLDRESRNVAEDLRQITMRYIFELLFATRRGQRERWLKEHTVTEDINEEVSSVQGGVSGGEISFVQGGASGGQISSAQSGASGEQIDSAQRGAYAGVVGSGQAGQIGRTAPGRLMVRSVLQESTYREEEYAGFSAVGKVKTSDGRSIDFKIDVAMSRTFEMTFQKELTKVQKALKDPLVINFDAPAAQVRDQKFFFDLDSDGTQEEISVLEKGSGFLALDKNDDGRIGDGSELFGTGSGDGFRDLAAYDEDGNGWIDENDPVWSKLKIWTKDELGRDILYRLADKNVGAIYLGNVSTDFSLVGNTGETEGIIRKTGVFLYENGLAGTIQHLDLAAYRKEA